MNRYKETFQTWNKIAQLYEANFMDLKLYNDTYTDFCNSLSKYNADILEIGCGPGNITKQLIHHNPNFKITAIDISENMISLAKKNNPTASFETMDCREIHKIKSKFDAIICGFTLPYLSESDCKNLIANSQKLLSKEGIIYLSFVVGSPINSGYISGSNGDRMYFYYHKLQKIKNELEVNSFHILNLIEKEYLKSDRTTEIHTIIIAKTTKPKF